MSIRRRIVDADAILPPPRGLEVAYLAWNDEERIILSFPIPLPTWPAMLTPSEQEVAALALDGATNAEIARRRGTSERTVVNQIAAIFRKTHVSSRTELAARVFGR
jgi:DNA-binding NarL/FixJ family response regulator